MTEKPPIGDMRPKSADILIPPERAKELSEIIPKPDNQYHYKIFGDWQENREVYRVLEADNVISDYTFPDKADMSKVQFAARKTYAKGVNLIGRWVDQPVQYDKKTGEWKKLGILQKVKQYFSKETNIPAVVATHIVDGKEVAVLHTMESKRPVGITVKEAKIDTLTDLRADLGIKYKYMDQRLAEITSANRALRAEAAVSTATVAGLKVELAHANRKIADLNRQLDAERLKVDKANQANPHYSGPIYSTPNPEDVVEG
ncbi:MAG TPA: hypothetical protein VJB96_00005, partial [Patescibacteria group bacterium]|nr:hypothetical protein [Patescibacteria group bacterium]